MWCKVNTAGNTRYNECFKDPLTGKPVTLSVTLQGEKDTSSKRRLAMSELEKRFSARAKAAGQEPLTLAELFEKYKAYQEQTVKLSTRKRNNIDIRTVIDLLGADSIVDNLTVGYIRDKLLERTTKAVTLNEYIGRFKAMIRWGYDSEYITNRSIIDKLKRFKVNRDEDTLKPEDKYFEADQLDVVLSYMEQSQEQWYLLSKFLVLSGLRIGEALALTKSDISETEITVNKTYYEATRETHDPKTACSNRQVYIQPELAEVIKQIKRYHRNVDILTGTRSDLLFHSSKGEHISYGAFNKYVRETTEKVIGERRTPTASGTLMRACSSPRV